MGIRSSNGNGRARPIECANTNKRRRHVKLRASNGRIATAYAAQS
jgi:hypothetical protein